MDFLNKKEYTIPIVVAFVFFMFYKPVICFLILGSIVTTAGVYFWFFLIDIQKTGIRSAGKILFYESDEEGYKIPIIEFKTLNGKQVKKKPYYYSSTDLSKIRTYKNKINKRVFVLYDRERPERFIIEKESGFNYFSLILITLVGLVFLIVGVLDLLEVININF